MHVTVIDFLVHELGAFRKWIMTWVDVTCMSCKSPLFDFDICSNWARKLSSACVDDVGVLFVVSFFSYDLCYVYVQSMVFRLISSHPYVTLHALSLLIIYEMHTLFVRVQ